VKTFPFHPSARRWLLPLLGVAAVAVTGCGSSSGSNSTGSSASASPAASTGNSSGSGQSGPIVLPTGKVHCGATSISDDPCKIPAAPPTGKHVTIGYFGLANNTFSAAIYKGIQEEAAKYNASVTPLLNPFSFSVQESQMRDSLAAQKFDAYIVFPFAPGAIRAQFQQMVSQHIPFATVGSNNGPTNSSAKLTFPGQTLQISRPDNSYAVDEANVTKQVCQSIKDCQVGFIRGTAALNFDTSEYQAYVNAIKSSPNIKLVQTVFGNYLSSDSETAMKSMITVHPDLNVVVTLGDQMSQGAALALQAVNKLTQVKIISAGGGTTAVAAIKAHRWYASAVTLPLNEGIIAADAVISAVRGHKLSLGIANIDTRGDLPSILTQTNEAQWKNYQGQWSGL
jgi:ABC-type sugar transport system substrate-binding protein